MRLLYAGTCPHIGNPILVGIMPDGERWDIPTDRATVQRMLEEKILLPIPPEGTKDLQPEDL